MFFPRPYRWTTWPLIILGLSGWLFHTSFAVQDLQDELARKNRQILHEQETIQVVRAEISVLTDPARIDRLAVAHIGLRPTERKQIIPSLDALPTVIGGLSATPSTPAAKTAAPLPAAKTATASTRAVIVVAPAGTSPAAAAKPTSILTQPAKVKPTPSPIQPPTLPRGDIGSLIKTLGH